MAEIWVSANDFEFQCEQRVGGREGVVETLVYA